MTDNELLNYKDLYEDEHGRYAVVITAREDPENGRWVLVRDSEGNLASVQIPSGVTSPMSKRVYVTVSGEIICYGGEELEEHPNPENGLLVEPVEKYALVSLAGPRPGEEKKSGCRGPLILALVSPTQPLKAGSKVYFNKDVCS